MLGLSVVEQLLRAGALRGGEASPCWGSPWWSSSSVLGLSVVEKLLHAGALHGEAAPPCWGSPWWSSFSALRLTVVEQLLHAGAHRGGEAFLCWGSHGGAPPARLFLHGSASETRGLGWCWDHLSNPPVPSSQQPRGNECFGAWDECCSNPVKLPQRRGFAGWRALWGVPVPTPRGGGS